MYRVLLENRGRRPLAGASVAEAFRDPRPSYAEWRAAREPGEEHRIWFDRAMGYFRWRWLIERRVPETEGGVELDTVAPGESVSAKLSFTPRRRGRIELAGLTVRRPDPLGLVYGLARLPLPASVTALPRRYRLPAIVLPGRRRFQPGGVSLASSAGDSEEFLSLRDYRPGDPLHRLHWKSFARAGRPIVREFQDEYYERHALVLDTGAALEDAAFEEAVALAASFVCTIDTQECLLDLLFVAGEPLTYTAGRGQLHAGHMLEILAGVQPSPPDRFDTLARAALARRSSLASVIAVLLAWDEPRRRFVATARGLGLEVRTLLVCPRGDAPREPGLHVLHPGEMEQGLASLR